MPISFFQLALGAGAGGNIDIVGTGNHQTVLFYVIAAGALIGMICAFINIFSKACDSPIISFAIDFSMTVCCAAAYIITIYLADYGVVRVYSALAYLFSLSVFRHFTEKLIRRTRDRVSAALKRWINYLKKKLKIEEKKEKRNKKKQEKLALARAKYAEDKKKKEIMKKQKAVKRTKRIEENKKRRLEKNKKRKILANKKKKEREKLRQSKKTPKKAKAKDSVIKKKKFIEKLKYNGKKRRNAA